MARDLANLTTLEDSPLGPQHGIDVRPRSRKSTLGSATAVGIQQGIAAGAEDEPQDEPSEAEDTEVIDKVDTVREGSRPGLGDNRPGKQGDVQKSPMREPSHTPVKRRRSASPAQYRAAAKRPSGAWKPEYAVHFSKQDLDESEEVHELWRTGPGKSRSASLEQTNGFPPGPPRQPTEFLAITEGATWNPLGSRHPQHVATRPFNAPPSNSVEEDPLGNWDTFLIASQVCSGQEAMDTMGAVKAFYISNGFHKPRNLVGLTESIL